MLVLLYVAGDCGMCQSPSTSPQSLVTVPNTRPHQHQAARRQQHVRQRHRRSFGADEDGSRLICQFPLRLAESFVHFYVAGVATWWIQLAPITKPPDPVGADSFFGRIRLDLRARPADPIYYAELDIEY